MSLVYRLVDGRCKKGQKTRSGGILADVLGGAVMSFFVALGRFGGLGCVVGNICHCVLVRCETNEGGRWKSMV